MAKKPYGGHTHEPPYMIAEILPNGAYQFSANPQRHYSMFIAEREADRLQTKHPFKTFAIVGTVLVKPVNRDRVVTVGEVFDYLVKNSFTLPGQLPLT